MTMRIKHACRGLLLSACVTMPSAVLAQEGASATQDRGAIEDIIVTAQRREQNVQDVPIAISAISGDALAETGIRDPRDLTLLVPSLSMQAGTAASTTSLFIRGVGIGDFNSNTTGAVGVYVDDVFLGANAGKLFNIFDSEGIEVLRGPQGTLYGRNTTGGAIRFSSRKPTDTFSGNASLLYGRFNEVAVEAGVGGPIVPDRLKVRVAGLYHDRGGTTYNRVTGHHVNDLNLWAARMIVDFTPSENALLRFAVHGGRNKGDARQFQHRGQGVDFFGDPAFLPDGTPTDGLGYADVDGNPYAGDYNIEGKERISALGASLTGQFDFGGVTLTSITAYEQVNRATLEDTDSSPADLVIAYYEDRPRQWSQEVRLQSNDGGPFNWIVGGYYFHDKLKTDSAFDLLRSLRDPDDLLGTFDPENSMGLWRYPYTQTTKSYAFFGQADVELAENLTATLGLRYSHDRVRLDYHSMLDAIGGVAPVKNFSDIIVPLVDFDQAKSFSDLSWRIGIDYKMDDTLVYASFSKGYNSGGFSGAAADDILQLQPFKSENLYAYEAGFKTEFFDRKLRFNTAGFYYDYRDLQVFIFDLGGPVPVQRKLNGGNARIWGLETELTARPTRNLDLFAAMTWMHSKYRNFVAMGGTSYSGNRLVNSPKFAMSGGATLSVPLGDSGSIRARVDGTYTSPIYLFPDNSASGRVKGYGLLNARLSWQSADEKFEIALWGKNLTGTKYITSVAPIVTSDQLNYNDPRTYGVQLVAKF